MIGRDAPHLDAVIETFDLGRMDQLGFVVRSVEASLPWYRALFGDFSVVETKGGPAVYRGRPVAPKFKLAFGRCGDLEIELVEVLDGEAPHTEHLDRVGEGLHHVRFRVDDLEATRREMEAAGFVDVFNGSPRPGVTFAYLEQPAVLGHSAIELIQFDS